jgi:hypothetical protein
MGHGAVIASGLLGMVGTGVGVLLNHFLSRSARRDERIDDAKKAEYREVLAQLNLTFMVFLRLGGVMIALGPQEQRELLQAEMDSVRVLGDRLYIAGDLQRLNVMDRWTTAIGEYREQRAIMRLSEELVKISQELRDVALAKT